MSFVFILMLSALFCGMSSTTAEAYLDPGTGSMILQVLLGGVAGLALAGKLYWARILSFLRIRPAETPSEVTAADGSRPGEATGDR